MLKIILLMEDKFMSQMLWILSDDVRKDLLEARPGSGPYRMNRNYAQGMGT